MEPNSAAASPESTQTPAAETGAPAVDNFGFPTTDPLSTEGMSDAELEAEVDRGLGLPTKSGGTNEPATTPNPTAPTDGSTPPAGTPQGGAGTTPPATPPAVAEPEAAPLETPATPTEIALPDASDLWVEAQNADGEMIRLQFDPDHPESFLPEDFKFLNDHVLFETLNAKREMQQLAADRLAKYNGELETQANAESQQDQLQGWDNELQELISQGRMTAPGAPPADGKQYTEAEVAADPALQEMNAVFKFMAEDNQKRQADGRPRNSSYTRAYLAWDKQRGDSDAAAEQAKAAALVKQRGAIVGGSSAPASSDKGYVYKRGSARNIYQVPTDDI